MRSLEGRLNVLEHASGGRVSKGVCLACRGPVRWCSLVVLRPGEEAEKCAACGRALDHDGQSAGRQVTLVLGCPEAFLGAGSVSDPLAE